jgi:hypothetical protein
MSVLWEPQPRQAYAMRCDADQIFYGGAAGGGKTDCSLAFQMRGVLDYGKAWQGIIFRKTYPQLKEIIRRGKELYKPMGATYHQTDHVFRFPNGAEVWLANLEKDKDVEKYQGQQYTLIIFDELGNWLTDYCWMFMSSRNRSPAGVPCQMLGTGNPGGVGHVWIKNMFIDGFQPDVKYLIPVAYDEDAKKWEYISRCFIPARLEDNPKLLEKDPKYRITLLGLPKPMRRALYDGDWDVFGGQMFDEWRRERHVIKPFALAQDGWRRFYALDWGSSKPYAIVKLAVNYDGKVIQYGEIYGCQPRTVNTGTKESSPAVAKKAWDAAVAEGVTELIADPACWNKQDSAYPAPIDALKAAGFRCIKANNDRKAGLQVMHDYLKENDENGQPMFQAFNTCYHTIRTLPALMPAENDIEDVNSKMEDHLYDAVRYGLMSRYAAHPQRFLNNPQMPPVRRTGSGSNGYSPLENW